MRQFSTAYKYGIRVMSTEFRENLLPYYYSVFCIHQIQCSRADYYTSNEYRVQRRFNLRLENNLLRYYYSVFCIHRIQYSRANYYTSNEYRVPRKIDYSYSSTHYPIARNFVSEKKLHLTGDWYASTYSTTL